MLLQATPQQGSGPSIVLMGLILLFVIIKWGKTTFFLQILLMICMRNWGPSDAGTILCLRMVLKRCLKDKGIQTQSLDLVHEIEHRYHAIIEAKDGTIYDMTVYADPSGTVQGTINN